MKQPKKEHIIRRLLWEARPIWKWLLLAALLCIGVIRTSTESTFVAAMV